jgi:tetratricopeptide (TPR) repeat protein
MWLGNSYLTFSPEDPARAEAHIRRAVVLEPTHPNPHDLLGDLYRARGEFPAAAAAYTRSAELSPPGEGGQAFNQRGHAHTFSGNYARARADYDTSIARSTGDYRAIYAAYRPLVQVHEGDPRAAVQELETVVGEIDGMGAADPDEMKVLALDMQATIAQHHGLLIPAERAVERLSEIWRRRAAEVGTDDFRRDRESEIAFWEGTLAARRGDYALARRKAAESMSLREADRDPTKDWLGQQLLGMTAQLEGKHAKAVSHYERSDPNNVYVTYHRALALEALGRTEEAKEIYRRVANFNFNDPAVALVRKDAIAKAR